MAKEEKNATAKELTDVRTSSGPAEANAPVLPVGKVQQGDGKAAGDRLEQEPLDTEAKKAVMVNPALRGDVEVPYYNEDDELVSETFVAGKVHYVDEETAKLKFGRFDMFVDPPEDNQE